MNTKQVIIIRKDLNMRKGKMVAQGAHASMAVLLEYLYHRDETIPLPMRHWLADKFTKICVYVNSEQELLEFHQKAKMSLIPCSLICDAGLTEFGGVPTYTAVAIGPDLSEEIDKITGGLPLL